MRSITNNYLDCEVIDLDPSPGTQGPFIVIQKGINPNENDLTELMYVLKRDGNWIDINYYLAQSDPALFEEVVFDSLEQIIRLFDELPPEPRIISAEIDRAKLKEWLNLNSANAIIDWAKNWERAYKNRKKARGN